MKTMMQVGGRVDSSRSLYSCVVSMLCFCDHAAECRVRCDLPLHDVDCMLWQLREPVRRLLSLMEYNLITRYPRRPHPD